jgi:DNA methylase
VELGRFGRNRSNLWTYAGANAFGADRMAMLTMHPTVKPVALVADAMRDCSTKGDIVLDPFLGSGSTIIAAEKIGRRGFGLDCKPLYIDVSARRWEAYTKSEAVLEGDGRTFAEVKEERLSTQNGTALQSEAPRTVRKDQPLPVSASTDDWASLCDEVRVTPDAGAGE